MKKLLQHFHIIKKKSVFVPLLVWFVLCLVTIVAFYRDLPSHNWIDIPTHIFAGIMITAFIFKLQDREPKKILLLAFLPFLGWEFFEIGAAMVSHNEFIINIFQESISNHIQDVSMDVLGFM